MFRAGKYALADNAPQDRDSATWRQLAGFDNFLDTHPEVAEQLRREPSLVNNEEFVENHPALKSICSSTRRCARRSGKP